MKARVAGEPTYGRERLVRAVVVQDKVLTELRRDIGFYGAQERKELFGAVTPMHFTNDTTGSEI